jgi:tetratricopeptide (TPR) repeat protein
LRKLVPSLAVLSLLAGCAAPSSPSAPPQPPPDRQVDAFSAYLSAHFAASDHDMGQAARFYAQSLKNDPDNGGLLSSAFYYASASGDMELAGTYANRIVAKAGDDRTARLALAIVAFKHQDYAGVRKHLALSAKGSYAAFTVPLFDGWAAAASGDAAGATADMKALTAQSSAEGVGAFHAALIADLLGQRDAAETSYKKALSINPNSPRAIEAYANFLERQGRTNDASAQYRKFATNPMLSAIAERGLARIAAGKKPDPLIGSAQDGAAEALFGIAGSLTDQASAEVSILYLRMALYLRPDLAMAQLLLADRFEALHKYDEAIAVYAKVDKASPYYRMAAVQSAVDRGRLDQTNEAIRQLRQLAEAKPGDAETWITLGDSYRDANRYDDAIDAYTKAEKANGTPAKKDWPLFYARAMAEDKAHQPDKAEADLSTALKLSPEQPELLNYLGYTWVDQNKRIPEALTMLEKARTLRPYDGYIVDSVGWAYYRLGRYDDAAQTLEAAVLLVPGDATINDHFGDALWKAGRKMEARFQWNHALTFSEDDSEKASIEHKLKSGLTG